MREKVSKPKQTLSLVLLGHFKAQKMNSLNLLSGHISDTSHVKKTPLKKVSSGSHKSKACRISFSSSGVLLCLSFGLLYQAGVLLGHPQCLDYGPPFQPPFHLEFCSAYETFGCCDQEKDNVIAAKYWEIMDYIDPQGHELCGRYIKDILCQVSFIRNYHHILGGTE